MGELLSIEKELFCFHDLLQLKMLPLLLLAMTLSTARVCLSFLQASSHIYNAIFTLCHIQQSTPRWTVKWVYLSPKSPQLTPSTITQASVRDGLSSVASLSLESERWEGFSLSSYFCVHVVYACTNPAFPWPWCGHYLYWAVIITQ